MIDDDADLCALLTEYLARFGHRLTSAGTAAEGWLALRRDSPDLIILDIMLPDTDGLTVCREIRLELDIPIVMLTARGEMADRVVGLELGADDYLPKPFEPRELVARIESVLRRSDERTARQALTCEGLRLETETRRVLLDEDDVDLTTMEFELLRILMESRGVVLSRDRLLERLRGLDADVYDRSIDMIVSRLRQKLGDEARSPRFIKTVWRTGYQFVGREAP
ncbi:MAG: response regulator transcription factor [Acidobacteria bacterium]|nr:response regulator transcription factor [Acidobacteriota bacterium]